MPVQRRRFPRRPRRDRCQRDRAPTGYQQACKRTDRGGKG